MAGSLGIGIALLIIGLLGALFLPFGLGIIIAVVGLVLIVAYLLGFGRRAAEPRA